MYLVIETRIIEIRKAVSFSYMDGGTEESPDQADYFNG
jgi:hypothetical protein